MWNGLEEEDNLARAWLGPNDSPVWGDGGTGVVTEETEAHKFGHVSEIVREWLPNFSVSLVSRVRITEMRKTGENQALEEKRNQAFIYFLKWEDALRIKVTVSSDTVYQCHLLIQTKDKGFQGNFPKFSSRLYS